jgi:CRP/FNR family transcriptional regulator, nitrogen oxide reductase regulator
MNLLPFAGTLKSPFLAGLAEPDLNTVLSAASRRNFPAKTIVTEEGDPAEHLYLLLSGRARYFFLTDEGRKVILHWLVPGEIVGSMALLSETTSYMVSAETVGQTSMLMWKHRTIRSLVGQYPKLLDNALSFVSQYLLLYRIEHEALICQFARERLAHWLVNFASSIGRPMAKGIELDVTNEELAGAANVTLFTASRLLSDWQRKGWISKRRGGVVVHSLAKLISQATDRKQEGYEAETFENDRRKASR